MADGGMPEKVRQEARRDAGSALAEWLERPLNDYEDDIAAVASDASGQTAYAAGLAEGARRERAQVVAWLRDTQTAWPRDCAKALERGDHVDD